jgi:hypothetical protein
LYNNINVLSKKIKILNTSTMLYNWYAPNITYPNGCGAAVQWRKVSWFRGGGKNVNLAVMNSVTLMG